MVKKEIISSHLIRDVESIIIDMNMNVIYYSDDFEKYEYYDVLFGLQNDRLVIKGESLILDLINEVKEGGLGNSLQTRLALDGLEILITTSLMMSSLNPGDNLILIVFKGVNKLEVGDLRCIYSLTEVEENMCIMLINGKSLKDVSSSCGISYEHARQRIKVIFSKTQTKSQSQLICKLVMNLR